MTTTPPRTDDRDALGAHALSDLFDGELRGDAARFALKRLAHDLQWRDTCSRWQLAGDVLRGQAAATAPAGFAERVAAALASSDIDGAQGAGARIAGAATARPTPRHWSRWMGGAALAASVAVAALLVVRPTAQDAAPAAPPGANLAIAAPATPMPAMPSPSPVTPSGVPSAPSGQAAAAALATATAAVEAPGRAAADRRPRAASERRVARTLAARRAPVVGPGTRPDARADTAGTATVAVGASASDPFTSPPADALPSRPWPRAALPGYGGSGALTTHASSGDARSFYPFEPTSIAEPAAASTSDAPLR